MAFLLLSLPRGCIGPILAAYSKGGKGVGVIERMP
jgi:hypothetical protein